MADFARARRQMVDTQLRTSGVTDRRLLAVMGSVPRERFVPTDRQALAYIDEELRLNEAGRALPGPAPFARLVQLAGVKPDDRVLDLGCGSGYSLAVLSQLAAWVVGIDPDAELVTTARDNLQALGIQNAEVHTGPLDGSTLSAEPFDVIIVELAVAEVPQALWTHLREHGRLVALLGNGMTATAHLFVKTGADIAGRPDFNARMPSLAPSEATEFVF